MKICAVICEFNPFHNGHKFLIDQIKKRTGCLVVGIMSGNFTQRGECAIFEKYSRAKASVVGGVDLVLELPIQYACGGANFFARGAVSVIKEMGCVDFLGFGSESGEVGQLERVVDVMMSQQYNDEVKTQLKAGFSYAAASDRAFEKLGDIATQEVIRGANNLLAVEYLLAVKKAGLNISPITIKRHLVAHDSQEKAENFASASSIRTLIQNNDLDFLNYIPQETHHIYEDFSDKTHTMQNLERAIVYKLRQTDAEHFRNIVDVKEGLENRIVEGVMKANSLTEVYDNIKCKRYTYARIRRIVLQSFLNIDKSFYGGEQENGLFELPYIKALCGNENSGKLLKKIRENTSVPIITNFSQTNKLDERAKEYARFESVATDIYAIARDKIGGCREEYKSSFIRVLKNLNTD